MLASQHSSWVKCLQCLHASFHGQLQPQTKRKLDEWCAGQRALYVANLLPPNHISTLRDVPTWLWDDCWTKNFALLQAYVREHRCLPDPSQSYREVAIGEWLATTKASFFNETLLPARALALYTVPLWRSELKHDRRTRVLHSSYHAKFNQYSSSVCYDQRCFPPSEDGSFDMNDDTQWEQCFARVSAASKEATFRPTSLGKMCNWLRAQYASGTLGTLRVDALNQLPHWRWTVSLKHKLRSRTCLPLLQTYIAQHHKLPPARLVIQGYAVGQFVERQSILLANQQVSAEMMAKLREALPLEYIDTMTAAGNRALRRTQHVTRASEWNQQVRGRKVRQIQSITSVIDVDTLPVNELLRDGTVRRMLVNLRQINVREMWDCRTEIGRWGAAIRALYIAQRLPAALVEQLNSIPKWQWSRRHQSWYSNYLALIEYATDANARPPPSTVFKTAKIGQWVRRQRVLYAKGKLEHKRADALATIPGWSWEPRRHRFFMQCALLQRRIAAEQPLSRRHCKWAGSVRRSLVNGRLSPHYIPEARKLLQALPTTNLMPFELRVAQLFTFVNSNARLPRTASDDTTESSLARWCSRQRALYAQKILRAERAQVLRSIPCWFWQAPAPSFAMRSAVHLFVEKFDRIPLRNETINGLAVGRWVFRTKQLHFRGKLSVRVMRACEMIQGWQWTPSVSEKFIHLLREFIVKHGRVPFAREHYCGEALGLWCGRVRQLGRWKKLAAHIRATLDAIDGWTWIPKRSDPATTNSDSSASSILVPRRPRRIAPHLANMSKLMNSKPSKLTATADRDAWYAQYQRVLDSATRVGMLDWTSDLATSQWCAQMRRLRDRQQLDDERVKLLNEIPGWSWSAIPPFNIGLTLTLAFVSLRKRLPRQAEAHMGVSVGAWLHEIMHQLKVGKVEREQLRQLEPLLVARSRARGGRPKRDSF